MGNPAAEWTKRPSNNFGALRLLFAVLVILSHSSELVDGNPSREILTRIFGTLTFGTFAVDGFFLISGYLVTKSFQGSRSAGEYALKRVLRIYPGYVVAYLLCVFALGPFVGGQIVELSGVQSLSGNRRPARSRNAGGLCRHAVSGAQRFYVDDRLRI